MLLTIDHIKKIDKVLDVEGFTADELGLNNIHGSCFGWGLIEGLGSDIEGWNKWQKIYKPLYIVRAIEAINKDTDIKMDISQQPFNLGVQTYGNVNPKTWWFDCEFNKHLKKHMTLYNVDEAKEKAIIYILDHIGE